MRSRRLLIGSRGIPAMLVLAFSGGLFWLAVVLILHVVAVFEARGVIQKLGWKVPLALLLLPVVFFNFGTYFWGLDGYVCAGLAVFASLLFYFLRVYPDFSLGELAAGFWLTTYLGFFSFLVLLEEDCGWPGVFVALFLTWADDTLAYYVGTYWGRHKLAPVLSPNKTWEGCIAGVLGALGVGLVAGYLLRQSMVLWACAALVIGVIAQVGDLLESALKRQANLKDAGRILLGHGGVLDRFDSLLLVGPLAYFLFHWFGLGS